MKHWLYLLFSNPETFFTALMAIGTFFAVGVSLCLAKKEKVIVGGYIEYMEIFPDKIPTIGIKCINKSRLYITVTGCDLKFRDSIHAIWLRHTNEFPGRLAYGEEINFYYAKGIDFAELSLVKNIVHIILEIDPNIKKLDTIKRIKKIKKIMELDFRLNVPYVSKTYIGPTLLKIIAEALIEEKAS